jgi:hypothetical protein
MSTSSTYLLRNLGHTSFEALYKGHNPCNATRGLTVVAPHSSLQLGRPVIEQYPGVLRLQLSDDKHQHGII